MSIICLSLNPLYLGLPLDLSEKSQYLYFSLLQENKYFILLPFLDTFNM